MFPFFERLIPEDWCGTLLPRIIKSTQTIVWVAASVLPKCIGAVRVQTIHQESKWLYCYKELPNHKAGDFHEECNLDFFGTKQPPVIEHSSTQMTELAKNVVERHIAVPGVQPKLSLSVVKSTIQDGEKGRLTVVGALDRNYIFKL